MARLTGYALLPALVLALGYIILAAPSADLEFRPLVHPEGFRELVVATESTRPGSLPVPVPAESPRIGANVPPPEDPGNNVCRALFHDPTSPTTGDDAADVILVEFFDYQCPYCKTLASLIREVEREQPVRVIYKEWPILGEASTLAARAALAAARQGRYREFHRRLMESRFVPTAGYIDGLAAELGMDRARLRADMNGDEVALAISRTVALASALGLIGTPSLVVGRTIVHGAISKGQLESLTELEASAAQPIPC